MRGSADNTNPTASAKVQPLAQLQLLRYGRHVARDWHRAMINKWQSRIAEEILRRFEADICPALGRLPIVFSEPAKSGVAK